MKKKSLFTPPIAQAAIGGWGNGKFCQDLLNMNVGMVTLGGYGLCEKNIQATQKMIGRGREELIFPCALDEFKTWTAKNLSLKKNLVTQKIAINVRINNISENTLTRIKSISDYVDFFEFNAHCRQPEVLSINGGQTFVEDLDKLDNILEEIKQKANFKPWGIKIRGYKVSNNLKLIKILESNNITYLHIDMMQPGKPTSELSILTQFAKLTDIPIIANNFIRTAKDISVRLKNGATAVSMARPFLFSKEKICKLITIMGG